MAAGRSGDSLCCYPSVPSELLSVIDRGANRIELLLSYDVPRRGWSDCVTFRIGNRMPIKFCIPVLAVAVAFGAQRMVAAQSIAAVPQITVHELGEGERPLIDGHVDDMSWSTTESFSAFVQQEPNDGEPATERTEIRFLSIARTVHRRHLLRRRAGKHSGQPEPP